MGNDKEWSVFFYLNGNNELDPEMWKSMKDIIGADIEDKVNVIVQIARQEGEVSKIMRPQENLEYSTEDFIGTRRYRIKENSPILLEDMGQVNMANYERLKDFIKWGMSNYKAKRNMVVIAGHGFMVASLSDLAGVKPYTMGIYEMCKAMNDIFTEIGSKIDILLLDICYMNNIEILYELAKAKENTVENILTYIEDGPIGGLSYSQLLKCFNKYNTYFETSEILKDIIITLKDNLIAVNIDNEIMIKIKELFNNLGYLLLEKKEDKELFTRDSLNNLINTFYQENILKLLMKIIVFYNKEAIGKRQLLNVFRDDIYNLQNKEAFLKYYDKLSFGKNSYWGSFVSGKCLRERLNKSIPNSELSILTKDNIYTFIKIFNLNYSREEIVEIVEELYKYKEW